MNIDAALQVAMHAATDSEWGYESDEALAYLRQLDPSIDWEPRLLQAELESGRRTMGPPRPPDPRFAFLAEMFASHALDVLKTDLLFAERVWSPEERAARGQTVSVRVPLRYRGPERRQSARVKL